MGKAIALLVNDLHISKDTIAEFNANLDEALGICKDEDIHEMFVGGDVFTSRGSQTLDVLLAVKNAYQRAQPMGVMVHIAEGNHDKVDQESIFGYNHIFDMMDNINVIDTVGVFEFGDFVLAVMSYFPENGSFINKLNNLKSDLGDGIQNTILYIHEGIHGALGDFDIPGELPQDVFEGFKKVLVGHYHNRVHIEGTNIQYIGSSRQNNFGEDSDKGYTILFDDGRTRFIENEVNTRYVTLSAEIGDINSDFMDEIKKFANSKPAYKVRVRVRCTEAESKTFDKKTLIEIGASKVEFVTEKLQKIEVKSTSIDEKFDKNGIKKEYQLFCDDKGIDSEPGMKYLNMI